jgi:hypothetical protein
MSNTASIKRTPRNIKYHQCQKDMCDLGIMNKKEARKWLVQNHPDKNSDINPELVGKVTNCYSAKIFCDGEKTPTKTNKQTPYTRKTKQTSKKTQKPNKDKTKTKKFTALRQLGNWSNILTNQRLDNSKFSMESIQKELEIAAPKAFDLIRNIKELDEKDMLEHGTKFKHFIFSDVKAGGYGAKILSAILSSFGYNNLISAKKVTGRKSKQFVFHQTQKDDEYNSFAFLTSTSLFGIPPSQKLKKRILDRYNDRPDNVYGKDIRIIILDSGFKEGIDLFDVKYVHLYERLLSNADEKQAIGRATRFCGQSGLPFQEGKGWPLYVFTYNTVFSDEFTELYSPLLNKQTNIDDLILDYSELDKASIELGNQLYYLAPYFAVDYYLNKNVHFPLGEEKDIIYEDVSEEIPMLMMGGARGIKKGMYKNLMDIKCKGKCGKRSTKDVPAPTAFLENVLKRDFNSDYKIFKRETKKHKLNKREVLCNLMRENAQFCASVRNAWQKRYAIIPFIPKTKTKTQQLSKSKTLSAQHLVEFSLDNEKPEAPEFMKYNGIELKSKTSKHKTHKMNFREMRDYIKAHFQEQKWGKLEIKNKCIFTKDDEELGEKSMRSKQMDKLLTYTPTQDFVRKFMTPASPYKGLLLWHSVGTGKTCSAVATASTTFEREGYSILWVTRNTLKSDVWKNIFGRICHDIIAEEIRNGKLLPKNLNIRKRELFKHWIEPISYKQFTNLLTGKNQFSKLLKERNGEKDILRKTLIIVDEAHKLYSADLKASEKPDLNILKRLIQKSYKISGDESCKLLLMTATPFADSPMELFKLINLMKEHDHEKIPEELELFKQRYLDSHNKFTKSGIKTLANKLAGYISYLDRSKDVSQFASPIKINVTSLFTSFTRDEREKMYCDFDSNDSVTENKKLRSEIKEVRTNIRTLKQRLREEKKNKTQKSKECRSMYKGKALKDEKERCLEQALNEFETVENSILNNIEEQENKISELREKIDENKKNKKTKKQNSKKLKEFRRTMKKKNNQENALKKKFLNLKDADIEKLWKSKNETKKCAHSQAEDNE